MCFTNVSYIYNEANVLNKTVNNLLTFLLATNVLYNQENTNNLKKCSKIICVLEQPRKHN